MYVQIHIGTFTRSLLIQIARVTGSLQRAGLEVKESLVASSPAQFKSLEAGEFDLVMTSPDNALAYRFLCPEMIEDRSDKWRRLSTMFYRAWRRVYGEQAGDADRDSMLEDIPRVEVEFCRIAAETCGLVPDAASAREPSYGP
jgi:hypothetical protein